MVIISNPHSNALERFRERRRKKHSKQWTAPQKIKRGRREEEEPFSRISTTVVRAYKRALDSKQLTDLEGQELDDQNSEHYYKVLFDLVKEIEEKDQVPDKLSEFKNLAQKKRKQIKQEHGLLSKKRKIALTSLEEFEDTLEKEFEWEEADRLETTEEPEIPPYFDGQSREDS